MKSYTTVIDLTGRGSRQEDESVDPFLREPDPPLPPTDVSQLSATLAGALQAAGWSGLMPVQARAMPYIFDRQDLIVQSRTGSGKTGAFLMPLLELLDPSQATTQALVLTPTRELARQVENEFQTLKKGSAAGEALASVAVYGGVGYKQQIAAFKRGAQLVVGTPGRILDHLQRKTLSLKDVRVLVLDEADEMLSMGFYPDMRKLRRFLPDERQSYMFSATIPYRVRQLGAEFLRAPGFLSLSEGRVHIDTMAHWYYVVPPMEKDDALLRLIELLNPDSAIIFANTKKKVDYLAQVLQNFGYDAEPISGDLKQTAREKVMGQIRTGDLRFLVATDVAARGIDISDLSHVFMYDVPQDPEYYVHRAGRTARAGKTGMALTLSTMLDRASLLTMARRYEIELEKQETPTDEEVQERIAERTVVLLEDEMRDRLADDRERIERCAPVAEAIVRDGHADLIAMLLDAFYHQRVHRGSAPDAQTAASEDPGPPDQDALVEELQTHMRQKRNLQVMRLKRLSAFVRRMAGLEAGDIEGGEPELLAMLIEDYRTGRLRIDSEEPRAAPPKQTGPRRRDRPGRS